MRLNTNSRLLVLAVLLAATLLAALFAGKPARTAGPRIRMALPGRIGPWEGQELYYCQTETCMAMVVDNELEGAERCPACGGDLDDVSLAENRILPADTVIVRKQYHAPHRGTAAVSLVVSGSQRSSIHRPQWCLPGQGLRIASQRVVSFPVPGRAPLRAMRLSLRGPARRGPGPVYLYWFVGQRRETPHHLARLFWAAWENLVRNVRYRWVYVAVAYQPRAARTEDSELRSFVARLVAHLDGSIDPPPRPAPRAPVPPAAAAPVATNAPAPPVRLDDELSELEL